MCFPGHNSPINWIKEPMTSTNKGASLIISGSSQEPSWKTILVSLVLHINCQQFGTGTIFPSYTQHLAQIKLGPQLVLLSFYNNTNNKTGQKELTTFFFFFPFPGKSVLLLTERSSAGQKIP